MLDRGPSWDPSRERRAQDGWDAHAEFMDELVDEGLSFSVADRRRPAGDDSREGRRRAGRDDTLCRGPMDPERHSSDQLNPTLDDLARRKIVTSLTHQKEKSR
jgi:hypothetical protein